MASKLKQNGLPAGLGFYWKGEKIYVAIWHQQTKHTFCTGTDDLAGAKTFRNQKISELEAGTTVKVGIKMPEIFADYVAYLEKEEKVGTAYTKTGRTTSNRTNGIIKAHLGPFFETMTPGDVRKHLSEYDSKRIDAEVSVVTINGEYRILRAAMNLGYRNDKVAHAQLPKEYPIRHALEEQAARKGTITVEQRNLILANADPLLKAVFALAFESGIRPKEISFIRPEQVFLDENPRIELRAGETKNGKARTPQINNPEVIEYMKQWVALRPKSEWFFSNKKGKQITRQLATSWYKALAQAGIPIGTVIFYDTRRTARTSMSANRVSTSAAMAQLGHGQKMSARYDQHDYAEEIREKMAPKTITVTPAIAPVVSNDELKGKLEMLKDLFANGLIPESVYTVKVSALL